MLHACTDAACIRAQRVARTIFICANGPVGLTGNVVMSFNRLDLISPSNQHPTFATLHSTGEGLANETMSSRSWENSGDLESGSIDRKSGVLLYFRKVSKVDWDMPVTDKLIMIIGKLERFVDVRMPREWPKHVVLSMVALDGMQPSSFRERDNGHRYSEGRAETNPENVDKTVQQLKECFWIERSEADLWD